jgi:small subunit ribosomal protein S15
MLTKEQKREITEKYKRNPNDTGSPESQVAIFSYRINQLTDHLRIHKNDFSTQRALLKLVGMRRRQLDYLKEKDIERYRTLIKELNIRK